ASPTITTPAMTMAGVILGTAAYMSPEQAKGRPGDKRSDIWAFGCGFYEMLVGERLFTGDARPETTARARQAAQRWERVSASARPVLRACLERDPRKRLRDIGDVWRLLGDESASARGPSADGSVSWTSWPAMSFLVMLAMLAGVALGGWLRPRDE